MGPLKKTRRPKVAFVLGGGGHLGAYEVGMLRALLEKGIIPNLIVGTSVGALNGAAIAAEPTIEAVERLESIWTTLNDTEVFSGSVISGAANLMRTRTSIHTNQPLRRMLGELLPAKTFEELKIPFQCVAASVETAAEHWFFQGNLIDAVLASSAVPGLLPPVTIDGQHYFDGGIVNSIPISRAVDLGAKEIYVLHVGRIEQPLTAPKNPWQVGMVVFEIARRHRFARDLASLPKGVIAHVLPSGEVEPTPFDSISQLRYKDFRSVGKRIKLAHKATTEYLANAPLSGGG